MRQLQWNYYAWEEYCYWQTVSRPTVKRINLLIRDIVRTPFDGTGKPEPLRGRLTGFWSRRIDEENRLVYAVEDAVISIVSCKGHYK